MIDLGCIERTLSIVNCPLNIIIRTIAEGTFTSAVLYPPHTCCTNTVCDQKLNGWKLQKVDQTHGVLYTLDKGVCLVWNMDCEIPM